MTIKRNQDLCSKCANFKMAFIRECLSIRTSFLNDITNMERVLCFKELILYSLIENVLTGMFCHAVLCEFPSLTQQMEY